MPYFFALGEARNQGENEVRVKTIRCIRDPENLVFQSAQHYVSLCVSKHILHQLQVQVRALKISADQTAVSPIREQQMEK